MTSRTHPLLFAGLRLGTPDQIMLRVIEQATAALSAWRDDWPANAQPECREALKAAQEALRARMAGDTDAAMLAAWGAGRAVERANAAFPVIDGLRKFQQTKQASDTGAEAAAKKRTVKANKTRDKVRKIAKQMIAQGKEPRALAAAIEKRLKGKPTAKTIREYLKEPLN